MQKRDNLKFRWNAILGQIDSNQDAGARQHRQFRMANLERLAAGQRELHRLKRTAGEHFSKGLNRHAGIIAAACRFNSDERARDTTRNRTG
jgi:hypothetical protein